ATLASPLVGLSSDALALVARARREAGTDAWAAVAPGADGAAGEWLARLPAVDRERLETFHARFHAERRSAARRSIVELIERALALTGYEQHVLSLRWGERRLANVHKLLRLAR